MSRNKWVPVLVMLAFLVVSSALDLAVKSTKNFMAATFRSDIGYPLLLLVELAFVGLVLWFAWYFFFRTRRSVLAAVLFLVCGIIGIFLSSPLHMLLPWFSRPDTYLYLIQDLPQPQRTFSYISWYLGGPSNPLRFLFQQASFGYLTKASILTLLLGIVAFFRRRW